MQNLSTLSTNKHLCYFPPNVNSTTQHVRAPQRAQWLKLKPLKYRCTVTWSIFTPHSSAGAAATLDGWYYAPITAYHHQQTSHASAHTKKRRETAHWNRRNRRRQKGIEFNIPPWPRGAHHLPAPRTIAAPKCTRARMQTSCLTI